MTLAEIPTESPIHVLVITLGMTGAVVTETLWAIAQEDRNAWPAEVRLIATGAAQNLLEKEIKNRVRELSKSLELTEPTLIFRVATDIDGEPIGDIRTASDVIAFADLVAEEIRNETAMPSTILHTSIAGGRKTMSYHAGAAMTIYARERDRLSHVLVDPSEFETRDFWWPDQGNQDIKAWDGVLLQARDAKLDLVDMVFPRLRPQLPPDLLEEPLNYKNLAKITEAALRHDKLILTKAKLSVQVGETTFELPVTLFALLWYFAKARVDGDAPVNLNTFNNPLEGPFADLLDIEWGLPGMDAEKIHRYREEFRKSSAGIEDLKASHVTNIRSYVSRLKTRIEKEFAGSSQAKKYTIYGRGVRYLALDPNEIRLR